MKVMFSQDQVGLGLVLSTQELITSQSETIKNALSKIGASSGVLTRSEGGSTWFYFANTYCS